MDPPGRLSVPTCFGCGAMALTGTCETGCSERRLELVRGAAYDSLVELRAGHREAVEAFAGIAEELAERAPGLDELPAAYRALQEQARCVLRRHPDRRDEIDLERPSEPAVTWWCPECGGLDAPQPCLGVCVWRPVEWVRRGLYDEERRRALEERDRERALRRLLRQLAAVTPRPDQWQANWLALQRSAHAAMSEADGSPAATGAVRATSSSVPRRGRRPASHGGPPGRRTR